MRGGCLAALLAAILLFALTGPATAEQRYVVRPGDTLNEIAQKFYGDESKWPFILGANHEKLQDQGRSLREGTELIIPVLDIETAPTYGVVEGQRDDDSGRVMIDLVAAQDLAPFSGEGLPNGGLVTEIVTRAFVKLGYKPTVAFAPLGPAPDPAEFDSFAATFPYLRGPELKRGFLLSDGILPTRSLVYWHRGAGPGYEKLEDLRGMRTCTPHSLFDSGFETTLVATVGELMLAERPADCFRAVLQNEVDAVVAGDLDGGAALAALGLGEEIGVSQAPLFTGEISVLFPKLSAHGRVLRYQFNETIEKMKASGEFDRIVERHLQPGAEPVAVTAAAESLPRGPGFAVVLAAFKSRDDAERYSAWVAEAMGKTLGSLRLETETLDSGGSGSAFRVTTEPLENELMAREVCNRLGWPTCEVVER